MMQCPLLFLLVVACLKSHVTQDSIAAYTARLGVSKEEAFALMLG